MLIFLKKTAIFLPAVFLFILDRILKRIFLTSPSSEVFLLGDFLKLKLAFNRGIAFGLGAGIDNSVFLFFCFFAFVVLCFFLIKSFIAKKYFIAASLSLIAFGAFSNILDRLYSGGVIDYLDLKYFTVFNLADISITVGAILTIVKILSVKKR